MSTSGILDAFGGLRRELGLHSVDVLKDLDIGRVQMLILLRLEKAVSSMTELAEYALCDKAAMTRAIASLEAAALIRRKTPDGDRRKVLVELTALGRKKSRLASAARDVLGDRLDQTLTKNERIELKRLLIKAQAGLLDARTAGE